RVRLQAPRLECLRWAQALETQRHLPRPHQTCDAETSQMTTYPYLLPVAIAGLLDRACIPLSV
ncbi:MAG: hypothetical protein AAFY15_15110, partial [Cyanobacteria bacterium J06648_11]